MLKNYFKIAWRNLRKYGSYSIINIAGLAVGNEFNRKFKGRISFNKIKLP